MGLFYYWYNKSTKQTAIQQLIQNEYIIHVGGAPDNKK